MGDKDFFSWVEETETGDTPLPVAVGNGIKRKARTKKKQFVGWGSRQLIDFLESIDLDCTQKRNQYDVTNIVNKYIKDRSLVHPTKKKRIVCDGSLLSLFGKKTIAKNKVYELMGSHLAENQQESDDDLLFSSEEDDDVGQRQTNVKSHVKKLFLGTPKSCFAAVIPDNIKHVYLKRSLVQNLLKEPDSFKAKVVGSFVRIKTDRHDYLQKNSHMLVKVTGLKKTSDSDDKFAEITLQVSNYMKDVTISMLSDDNFLEEECEDLHQRIANGLLQKPNLAELEERVQLLHEDITNHWIVRELVVLQKLIDQANEKGWRKELTSHLDKRQLLQTADEQSRLLREVPEVIAEEIETEMTPEDYPDNQMKVDNGFPESSPNDGELDLSRAGESTYDEYSPALGGVGDSSLNGGSDILKFNGAVKGTPLTCKSSTLDSADCLRDSLFKGLEKQLAEICSKNSKIEPVNAQKNSQVCLDDSLFKGQEKQPMEICFKESEIEPVNVRKDSPGVIDITNDEVDPANVQKNSPGVIDITNDEVDPANVQKNSPDCLRFLLVRNQGKQPTENCLKRNSEIEPGNVQKDSQGTSDIQVIDLSDDEENEDPGNNNHVLDYNVESCIWYYSDPEGHKQGPFTVASLKRWSDGDYFPPNFKVWRIGQSQKEAVLLQDILSHFFPINYRK